MMIKALIAAVLLVGLASAGDVAFETCGKYCPSFNAVHILY